MDIRSLIDPEPPKSVPKRESPSQKSEARQPGQASSNNYQGPFNAPPPGHHSHRDTRPPQPPPLQAPAQTEFGSSSASSYPSALSPYQHAPATALSGGQYPFPQHTNQSPSHVAMGYTQRDGHSAPLSAGYPPYGQSTPSTPGSAQTYVNQTRPQSSHSSTPTSAQAHATSFPRQSPSNSRSQNRGPPQNLPNQPYPSQPNTPLGPPSTLGRTNTGLRRESPSPYGHSRTHSGGSFGHPPLPTQSPIGEHQALAGGSPQSYNARQSQPAYRDQSASVERERSLSVSPKTRLPSQPKVDVSKMVEQRHQPQGYSASASEVSAVKSESRSSHDQSMNHGPTRSITLGVNGILNGPAINEDSQQTRDPPKPPKQTGSQDMSYLHGTAHQYPNSPPGPELDRVSRTPPVKFPTASPTGSSSVRQSNSSQHPVNTYDGGTQPQTSFYSPKSHSSTQSHFAAVKPPLMDGTEGAPGSTVVPLQHLKAENSGPSLSAVPVPLQSTSRKRQYEEPPIWAQSSRKGRPRNPFMWKDGEGRSRAAASAKREAPVAKAPPPQSSQQPPANHEGNGHVASSNVVQVPRPQPKMDEVGPLGPWEPSILNIIPSEEVTRVLSDFLFTEVVIRDDVGVALAGGGKAQGAVLEIEAKLGQLIDKNTNDRIRIPVMSECVVCRTDPSLRIAFKSSMTEAQHRALNGFLNKALVDSQPPQRMKMAYVHTYENDTFYDMSQNGALSLPASIRKQMDPRNPRTIPKIRVTHNKKTGEEIAKIVKARVADIDVYSPRTAFDWRVSVNVEMRIEGDLRDLVEPGSTGRKGADRNKDRMSYRHLAYQIDLTQVTSPEAASKFDKEHELEIEVSSLEVRRQGQLARDGNANQYDELVRGFADN
ncbi:MAG: hypothetical protein Q9191_006687, partial [Dirinaria sp. TL-2023a]